MKGSKKNPSSPPKALDIVVPDVDFGQLERLLSFMSEHSLEEFEYTHGDLRIRLKKAGAQPSNAQSGIVLPAAPVAPAYGTLAQAPPPATNPPSVFAGAQPAQPVAPVAPDIQDQHVIKSPIVGTFYAGASPEATPFVRVGVAVAAGQTVCIIEAMKLMNEIEADISGEVVRIFVENGQPVEYGEPLFALRPSGNKK